MSDTTMCSAAALAAEARRAGEAEKSLRAAMEAALAVAQTAANALSALEVRVQALESARHVDRADVGVVSEDYTMADLRNKVNALVGAIGGK